MAGIAIHPPVFNLPQIEDGCRRERGIPRNRNFAPKAKNLARR
jgi:hypothetical protein